MILEVKLFARAKDLAGEDSIQVQLEAEQPTVHDLKIAMAEQSPTLAPLVPHLLVAIGTDYAEDSTVLDPSHSIACFPPVSGG
jgi:sulfur-carrier protein